MPANQSARRADQQTASRSQRSGARGGSEQRPAGREVEQRQADWSTGGADHDLDGEPGQRKGDEDETSVDRHAPIVSSPRAGYPAIDTGIARYRMLAAGRSVGP